MCHDEGWQEINLGWHVQPYATSRSAPVYDCIKKKRSYVCYLIQIGKTFKMYVHYTLVK